MSICQHQNIGFSSFARVKCSSEYSLLVVLWSISILFSVKTEIFSNFQCFQSYFRHSSGSCFFFFKKSQMYLDFFVLVFGNLWDLHKLCPTSFFFFFLPTAMRARVLLFFRQWYDSSSWSFVRQPAMAVTQSNAELADCKLSWQGPSALSVQHREEKNLLTLIELSILWKSSCT